MAIPMILFDDGRGEFGPLTDLRAAFEIRTGMFTTGKRLTVALAQTPAAYWVPPRLSGVVADRTNTPINQLPTGSEFLCINGRWVIPQVPLKLRTDEALIDEETEHVIAARLQREDVPMFLDSCELPDRVKTQTVSRGALYHYAWEIIGRLKETVSYDIDLLQMHDAMVPHVDLPVLGHHPVKVHRSAKVYPDVTFDAEKGPIAIEADVVIRPGAILCGPCAIGHGSTVLDQTLIKAHTAIGPMCKVAGEVGATVFQSFSNKAHDGHLGDSYVGKWVNLGAGTTNSNLLNTYSQVVMKLEPDGRRYQTGMTFLGTIFGDHVKTAICTRIMTGTVLSTGAMIATTAPPPTTVRRFSWLTDKGEHLYRYAKFIEMMKAVMARRDIKPSEAYLTLIQQLYEKNTENKST